MMEVRQNGMGRWLWDVGNVRNELIRGETGWSTFEEREAKVMVKWILRVVFEENLMSEIGRACLVEIGCKSRWWARCRHICSKFGLIELVNLIWLRDASVNGTVNLRMNVEEEVWKKNAEREKEYVRMKECPGRESFSDGSVGTKVRLMVRGGCLPVRESETMKWKYQDDLCGCGQMETEVHVLFDMDKSEND